MGEPTQEQSQFGFTAATAEKGKDQAKDELPSLASKLRANFVEQLRELLNKWDGSSLDDAFRSRDIALIKRSLPFAVGEINDHQGVTFSPDGDLWNQLSAALTSEGVTRNAALGKTHKDLGSGVSMDTTLVRTDVGELRISSLTCTIEKSVLDQILQELCDERAQM